MDLELRFHGAHLLGDGFNHSAGASIWSIASISLRESFGLNCKIWGNPTESDWFLPARRRLSQREVPTEASDEGIVGVSPGSLPRLVNHRSSMPSLQTLG